MLGYYLDLLIVGLSLGMVYGLVALGISLIFSGLDIIHFAHGEIYMLGAFFGLAFFQGMLIAFPNATDVLIVAVLALLLGAICELILRNVASRSSASHHPFGRTSLKFALAVSVVFVLSIQVLPPSWSAYRIKLPAMHYSVALLLAAALTGLVGMFIERVFYRRLTRAGGGYTVAGLGMVIAGFGMSIVLQNVAFLNWGPKPLPFPVEYGPAIEIGNLTLPRSYIWIVVAAFGLMIVLNLVLKKTMLGLAIRAVAHNKDIAYLSGVNVPLMISIIFGTACALGAAAGILIGPINYPQVLMGVGILVKAFAAAVVGGFGSLPGAVLGGLLVGVAESLGAGYLSGSYKDIYAFVLLIVVLMLRPTGFFGVLAKVKA